MSHLCALARLRRDVARRYIRTHYAVWAVCLALLILGEKSYAASDCGLYSDPKLSPPPSSATYSGFLGDDLFLPFLKVDYRDGPYNESKLFFDKNGNWQGVQPRIHETIVGIYAAGRNKWAAITDNKSSGSSPSWWTVYFEDELLGQKSCVELDFPTALQLGEYLTIDNFNIDANGVGEIVGHADLERPSEKSGTWWFSYTTSNFGKIWNNPQKIERFEWAVTGSYRALMLKETPSLQKELQKYVENR